MYTGGRRHTGYRPQGPQLLIGVGSPADEGAELITPTDKMDREKLREGARAQEGNRIHPRTQSTIVTTIRQKVAEAGMSGREGGAGPVDRVEGLKSTCSAPCETRREKVGDLVQHGLSLAQQGAGIEGGGEQSDKREKKGGVWQHGHAGTRAEE